MLYIACSIARHNEISVYQQLIAQSIKVHSHVQTHTSHHKPMKYTPNKVYANMKTNLTPTTWVALGRRRRRYAKEGHGMAQKSTHPLTVIINTTTTMPWLHKRERHMETKSAHKNARTESICTLNINMQKATSDFKKFQKKTSRNIRHGFFVTPILVNKWPPVFKLRCSHSTSTEGKTLNPTLKQFANANPTQEQRPKFVQRPTNRATQSRAIVPTSCSNVLADTKTAWIERSANSVGRARRSRIDHESWIKCAFQKHWLQAGDSPTRLISKKIRCAFPQE